MPRISSSTLVISLLAVACRSRAGDESEPQSIPKTAPEPSAEQDPESEAEAEPESSVPQPLRALALAVAHQSGCAVTSEHEVVCWGSIAWFPSPSPDGDRLATRKVPGLTDAVDVALGSRGYACALTRGRTLQCWDDEPHPESPGPDLPKGYTYAARELEGLTDVVQFGLGSLQGCARTGSDEVWCWVHTLTMVSDPAAFDRPTKLDLDEVIDLSVAEFHACALTRDQGVYCWGSIAEGVDGGLGPTRIEDAGKPIDIESGGGANGVGGYTCARYGNEQLRCWSRFWRNARQQPQRRYRVADIQPRRFEVGPHTRLRVDQRGLCTAADAGSWTCRNLEPTSSRPTADPPETLAVAEVARGWYLDCTLDAEQVRCRKEERAEGDRHWTDWRPLLGPR